MVEDLVSIVLTTHNRCDLLPRAIESALQQTYPCVELLVIDDGSSDSTPVLMEEYLTRNSNLRYFRNELPKGACAARNYGIRKASGKFIIGLDDDDAFHPKRIEKLVAAYDPKWAFIASWSLRFFPDKTRLLKIKPVVGIEDFLWRNPGTVFPLIARDRIIEQGGFDLGLTASQDYDMWLRLVDAYGAAKVIQEPLYYIFTDHGKPQISVASENKIYGRKMFFKKHKAKMNTKQKRYFVYCNKWFSESKISWKEFFASVPKHLLIMELRRFIGSKLR